MKRIHDRTILSFTLEFIQCQDCYSNNEGLEGKNVATINYVTIRILIFCHETVGIL